MKKKLRFLLYRYVIPYAGIILVKLLSLTHRLRIVDPENEAQTLARDNSIIYASWHQRFFPGITFFATRKPIAIMISRSRDGEFIARIVDILGWKPVRGSATRGGRDALEELKELSCNGYKIGHIVDGPKGPFGEIKPGLLRIAQVSGKAIVPTITSAQKKWTANSWDKFMVPKWFSRVIIRFGDPVYVHPDLNEAEFERLREEIGRRMADLYADTDRVWEDPGRISAVFDNPSPAGINL